MLSFFAFYYNPQELIHGAKLPSKKNKKITICHNPMVLYDLRLLQEVLMILKILMSGDLSIRSSMMIQKHKTEEFPPKHPLITIIKQVLLHILQKQRVQKRRQDQADQGVVTSEIYLSLISRKGLRNNAKYVLGYIKDETNLKKIKELTWTSLISTNRVRVQHASATSQGNGT